MTTLLAGKMAKFNVMNLDTVALAIARLFSLPISSSIGPSLDDFENRFVYVSSFRVSQRDIFEAIQGATRTMDADWAVTYTDVQDFIDEGTKRLARGDFTGMSNLLPGMTMKEGAGGDYESSRGLGNEALELLKEDLDESIREVSKVILA